MQERNFTNLIKSEKAKIVEMLDQELSKQITKFLVTLGDGGLKEIEVEITKFLKKELTNHAATFLSALNENCDTQARRLTFEMETNIENLKQIIEKVKNEQISDFRDCSLKTAHFLGSAKDEIIQKIETTISEKCNSFLVEFGMRVAELKNLIEKEKIETMGSIRTELLNTREFISSLLEAQFTEENKILRTTMKRLTFLTIGSMAFLFLIFLFIERFLVFGRS